METGALFWRDDAVDNDIREMRRIQQKHNPGYAFPYYVPGDP